MPWKTRKSRKKGIPAKASKVRLLTAIAVVFLLIIAGIFIFPKIFIRDTFQRLRSSGERISIVIFPFQNITDNTTKYSLGDWVQEGLINYLSNFPDELNVRQIDATNTLIQSKGFNDNSSLTPSVASNISRKLNADLFVTGSVRQIGNEVRLTARLADSKTRNVLKAFEKGPSAEVLTDSLINSLRIDLSDFLILSQKKEKLPDKQFLLVSTSSPKAYSAYIYGKKAFADTKWDVACSYLSEALRIDSSFTFAAILLTYTYLNQGMMEEARKCIQKAYLKKDQIFSPHIRTKLEDLYALFTEGPEGRIKYLEELPNYDDQDPHNYSDLGNVYNDLGLYEKAIPEFEKALDIYKKWGTKPFYVIQYTHLGLAYHKTGQYKKEEKLYKQAEKDFPDTRFLTYRQAVLALSEGKKKEAGYYLEKFISILKESSASDASIKQDLAYIYNEGGILDKAENYYREALSLEPADWRRNELAYFLIDNDKNIDEGLALADTVLKSAPDDFNYLDTKGWGLYKKGKNNEALEILQRSWDLRMKNDLYYHEAFLHLEAAKKAVAELKN